MANHILDLLRDALVQYGYWAVAVALLLENSGLPVPGETVLLLASFLAYSSRISSWTGSFWWELLPRPSATTWDLP